MNTSADARSQREEPPRATQHGTVRTIPVGHGKVQVRKSSSRKLRDLPELDLRTPSGRMLPF
ncbi:hypothetical protein ABIA31_000203 [Catenulispora sp. MAP5-51]|uniref:hypothetical protein n=1 Tax=Catenulispora sp. MAP5-51 TaxID=3156298 RepID=UPI0035166B03